MLAFLPASHPKHQVRPRHTVLSLTAFGLLGASAFFGTRPQPLQQVTPVVDTTLVFLARLRPVASKDVPQPPRQRGSGLHGPGGGGGAIMIANPPPKGFQTVVAPSVLPTSLPAVDLDERPLDARDFSGKGEEGGVAWGVAGGTGKVEDAMVEVDEARSAGVALYSAEESDARFVPAQLISLPSPVYPRVLERAGIGGRVVIRFVVDTAGVVEQLSIKVVESTHEAFEAPARDAVSRGVFIPARLGERPVRQLCLQPIRFQVSN